MSQRYYVNQWDIPSTSGRFEQDKICIRCSTTLPSITKGKFCPKCGTEYARGEPHPSVYRVSQAEDGHWECSCPAWIFRRKDHGDCKHILAIQTNRGRIEEAMTQHQTVRIEHNDRILTIEDGRITGFLEFLGTHREDRPPVHVT